MPKSRKRHHSRSRSRSRSHSRDRSHERDDKHRKNDSHEKDRDGKRRKIESYDSPSHKRSVSSERQRSINEHPPSTASPSHQNEVDLCKESDTDNAGIIKMNETVAMENKTKINENAIDDKTEEKLDQQLKITPDSISNAKEEILVKPINKQNKVLENKKEELNPSSNISGIDTKNVQNEESLIVLDDSDDDLDTSAENSTLVRRKLEITPKKVSSPKHLQKKIESEKKRKERQLEKEEKERKRNEERERIKQEKLKRKKEKEMKEEQKRKEREEKEEQKKKEKEEKEEQKKREREEKEQKRKEREEREEQKRKEREQEKLKRQLEIEEKHKEKQREEEKKQKAAAAFVNFFVPKKTDSIQEDKKSESTHPYAFKAFEVKSDMKLPPPRREPLSEKDKEALEYSIENQDDAASYIKDLKSGKRIGKGYKTWPFEEIVDNDVTIIEDEGTLGETIYEEKSCQLQNMRAKFLKFHENRRPAYFGTWRKKSKSITPRKPFAEDKGVFNYEDDSDDDWEEEEQGESLNGSDDEADKENEDEKDDYEVDNEFFVPHGHLSDDEIDDEENARLSPESLKQKLKLLRDEFEQDIHSKTHKLKPRSIGCIWMNKDGSNVEEAILRYLQPFSIITNGTVEVGKRSEIFTTNTSKRSKSTKELDSEHIPLFLKVIHGNCSNKRVLIEQFMTYMANNGFNVDVKKTTLFRNLRHLATWRKCKENGPLKNKFCWLVNENILQKYNVDLSLPNVSQNAVKE